MVFSRAWTKANSERRSAPSPSSVESPHRRAQFLAVESVCRCPSRDRPSEPTPDWQIYFVNLNARARQRRMGQKGRSRAARKVSRDRDKEIQRRHEVGCDRSRSWPSY